MHTFLSVSLVLLSAAITTAQAQTTDYPTRPVRFITPAQAGGTTDILARLFGAKLSEVYKQQFVVDNRASASGVLAGELTDKAAQSLVRSGKLRGIAVTAPKRVNAYKDLPAMMETLPGFEVVGWYGVMGPAKLPKPIVSKLHGDLVKALNAPDMRERIVADGSEPMGTEPEVFRQYLLADMAKWAKLVKESGAKLD